MAIFAVLRHDEGVLIDPDRLVELYARLGERPAEELIARTLAEVGDRLSEIDRFAAERRVDRLIPSADRLAVIARTVGLMTLARVASDLSGVTARSDGAALGATLARLLRVADRTHAAIRDLHRASI